MPEENFPPFFQSKKIFLESKDAWSLCMGEIFSVANMTDDEIKASIVEDILSVTFWEKDFQSTLHFGTSELVRFLDETCREKVYKLITDPEISGLIECRDGGLRIKNHPEILKAAMDYCGSYYDTSVKKVDFKTETELEAMYEEFKKEIHQLAEELSSFVEESNFHSNVTLH